MPTEALQRLGRLPIKRRPGVGAGADDARQPLLGGDGGGGTLTAEAV